MNFSHHGAFLMNWTLLCNGTWKQSAWQTRGHWPSKWAIIIEIWRLTAPLPGRTCYVCQRCIKSQWDTRDLLSLGHWNYSITWFLTAARFKHAGDWMVIGFPFFPKNIHRVSKKTPHRKWRKTRHHPGRVSCSWAVGQFLSISFVYFTDPVKARKAVT